MPRPKRSKVVPSVPVQRNPQPAVSVASAVVIKKDVFSPVSLGRATNGSDDSDGLVISKKMAGKKTPVAQVYTMSGALAPEDVGPIGLRPPSAQTRATLSRIVREADHARAMERKQEARRVTRAVSTEEQEQIPSSIPTKAAVSRRAFSNRSRCSPVQQGIPVGSESRIQETPRLQSSSILGGAMFKKRPRQPSLLRMAKPQNGTPGELDDHDMYDFLPDDESTPLVKSLSQTNFQYEPAQHSSGSRKRKMRSPEIQVPASQSLDIRSSPSAVLSPSATQEVPSQGSDRPEPILPPLRPTPTPPPEVFSDTLAPPQSSSSPAEHESQNICTLPAKAPTKARDRPNNRSRKQPSPAPARSPLPTISAQITPVRPTTVRPLTTATLQNLLPRRRVRRKPKGDYDIPSSSDVELDNTALGEDEDELSFNAGAKMRRKKQNMGLQKAKAKGKDLGVAAKAKRISKTYTRKSLAESQDESASESASDHGDATRPGTGGRSKTPALNSKVKEEMKRLAEKFREVDEYTLDFEDMTGSSSQLKDAR